MFFVKVGTKNYERGGGSGAQWLAYLLSDTAALGLIPIIPEIFSVENY